MTNAGYYARTLLHRLMPGRYRHGQRLTQVGRLRFHLDYAIAMHHEIHRAGLYEPETTAVLARALRAGDVFYDVGANFGWYTVNMLARVSGLARVVAFEPLAQTFALLTRNVAANGFTGRAVLHHAAVSDSAGTTTIRQFPRLDDMHASLYIVDDQYTEETVPLITLDSVAEAHAMNPAVIKCDVEGHELRVLAGAERVCRGQFGPPPIWALEVNYQTAAAAGYFPWAMIELAATFAPYRPFVERGGRVVAAPSPKTLRHGETLILAIEGEHDARLGL
jgi:FkbM family methyltransferase